MKSVDLSSDEFRLSDRTILRSGNSMTEFRNDLGSVGWSRNDLRDDLTSNRSSNDGCAISSNNRCLIESFSEHFNSKSRSRINVENFSVFPNSMFLISLLISVRRSGRESNSLVAGERVIIENNRGRGSEHVRLGDSSGSLKDGSSGGGGMSASNFDSVGSSRNNGLSNDCWFSDNDLFRSKTSDGSGSFDDLGSGSVGNSLHGSRSDLSLGHSDRADIGDSGLDLALHRSSSLFSRKVALDQFQNLSFGLRSRLFAHCNLTVVLNNDPRSLVNMVVFNCLLQGGVSDVNLHHMAIFSNSLHKF